MTGGTPSAGADSGPGGSLSTGRDAGPGGARDGGVAGASATGGVRGSGGAGGSGVAGAGGTPPGFIHCGDGVSCDTTLGLACCSVVANGVLTARCTRDATGCTIVFACDSDSDCPSGNQCCFNYTLAGGGIVGLDTSCAPSCARPGSSPMSCSGPSDCPGQLCCGLTAPFGGVPAYSNLSCQAACSSPVPQVSVVVTCDTNRDCPLPTRCVPARGLPPGYRTCQ